MTWRFECTPVIISRTCLGQGTSVANSEESFWKKKVYEITVPCSAVHKDRRHELMTRTRQRLLRQLKVEWSWSNSSMLIQLVLTKAGLPSIPFFVHICYWAHLRERYWPGAQALLQRAHWPWLWTFKVAPTAVWAPFSQPSLLNSAYSKGSSMLAIVYSRLV